MYSFLSQTLVFFCPLMIAAIGGASTEKSGVTNIALDGMMILGSLIGILVFDSLASLELNSFLIVLIYLFATICAAISGMIIALIHAFAAVHLKSNEVISATTLNMFSTAIAPVIAYAVLNSGYNNFGFETAYFYQMFGNFQFYPSLILGIIILVALGIMFRFTKFGFRLKAAGENPYALASAGMNVEKYRTIGVILSGALCGVAGFIYLTSIGHFNGSLSGIGFLALAMMIGGNWNIWLIALFCLIFSAISNSFYLVPSSIYKNLIQMIPFLLSIVLAVVVARFGHQPEADGIPYYRERK